MQCLTDPNQIRPTTFARWCSTA